MKTGFPYIDGQFLNEQLPLDKNTLAPGVHVILCHDERDGEIRVRIRRYGTFDDSNEVEIGISKTGFITTFTHYDS